MHPAKADVRFRDPGLVRGLIVGAIREALAGAGIRGATTGAAQMISAFRTGPAAYAHPGRPTATARSIRRSAPPALPAGYDFARSPARPLEQGFGETAQAEFDAGPLDSGDARAGSVAVDADLLEAGLGAARAQIHENYIVAQTARFANHRRPACRA